MSNRINWRDLTYLQRGSTRQREAFETTIFSGILEKLAPFHPTLVSTVCVGLDIEGSDLDFICQFDEPETFEDSVRSSFGSYPKFRFRYRNLEKSEAVTTFECRSFIIEIFGSVIPVEQQNAYRHLTVMSRLLKFGGDALRSGVRQLKHSGLKTEPALAKILGLSGDPYRAILGLERASDSELQALIQSTVKVFDPGIDNEYQA
jgi:hypothetical protein